MSCTSSPICSSFGEQAVSYHDTFVLPSETTREITSVADVSHYGHTYASGNGNGCPISTRAVNIHTNVDAGPNYTLISYSVDEQNNETFSCAHQLDAKDWWIFNSSSEACPITIDGDFNKDADATLNNPPTSYEIDVFEEDVGISLDDFPSYNHTAHIAVALADFENRSQTGFNAAHYSESMHQETLLQDWQYGYQRHEWVALKFQQAPYTTEPYCALYSTKRQ